MSHRLTLPLPQMILPDWLMKKLEPLITEGAALIADARESNRLLQQLLQQQIASASTPSAEEQARRSLRSCRVRHE